MTLMTEQETMEQHVYDVYTTCCYPTYLDKTHHTSVGKHFYQIKITTTWNALLNEVVSSRDSFKNRLDKHRAKKSPRCPS